MMTWLVNILLNMLVKNKVFLIKIEQAIFILSSLRSGKIKIEQAMFFYKKIVRTLVEKLIIFLQ